MKRGHMGLQIVVGIATAGRPAILAETLSEVMHQTRPPDRIIICATGPEDVSCIAEQFAGVEVYLSEKGLPRQRNVILDAAADADLVLFIDDDFLMQPDYVGAMLQAFAAQPDAVVATGHVIADGIGGPGLTPQEGRRRLREDVIRPTGLEPVFAGYGCNMVVQAAVARRHGVRFDPRLPLYGWQEDVDMTRRLAAHGTMVRVRFARGVHLGVKSGRGSGTRLGYSQIANPLYLHQHSNYPLAFALQLMARNVAANLALSLRPEAYIDRRGRLRGNLLALRDLVKRRLVPERVLDL